MSDTDKEKLFFAISRDSAEQLTHTIVYRKDKKMLSQELKAKDLVPLGFFAQNDIDDIISNNFKDSSVPDSVLNYLKEHIADWEKNF